MATIKCPHCSEKFDYTHRTGRPRHNINVKNVLNALQGGRSVMSVAEELGIDRGNIYNRLKEAGYDVREITKGNGGNGRK